MVLDGARLGETDDLLFDPRYVSDETRDAPETPDAETPIPILGPWPHLSTLDVASLSTSVDDAVVTDLTEFRAFRDRGAFRVPRGTRSNALFCSSHVLSRHVTC